ncbi:hypothetical protein CS006_03205 [Bifidobacterium primatium]|uniref:Uncharacterized protein n=1 Tax=Bifidobacterium primatium TaxID=2045438 RepID=A0A2M9HBG1_9BIFI|nr:hypothetical protein [Bifidobacterium primatium]PJM74155.1 hypothetical protein CS006_03205 [Bifidobacterium primatium]
MANDDRPPQGKSHNSGSMFQTLGGIALVILAAKAGPTWSAIIVAGVLIAAFAFDVWNRRQ